jgi:hypothetical protein
MDGPTQALEAGTHFLPVSLAPGANIVYIDARDTLGNEADRIVFDVYRDNSPPVASARGPRRTGVGSDLAFDGTGSTDDHGIVEWTWTFTYLDQNVTLVGPTPRFAFQEPGTYTVTLTVTDSAGNSASDSLEVVVGDEGSSEVPWTILAVAVFLAVFLPLYLLYSRHLDRNG